MRFTRRDQFYQITRISGPRHNFLSLAFGAHQAGEPRIEALPPRGECRHAPIDAQRILDAALQGVEVANARFGTQFTVRTVRYVPNDTGPEEVYQYLALTIVERIHHGGSFDDVQAAERTQA